MEMANPRQAELPLYDLLVIGSGPTGMACAIEAQRRGFTALLVDKGCLCNSLFHYPAHMTFFTTPELLEIGDIPFSTPNQKPCRAEALEYYRKVAERTRSTSAPMRRSSASAATTTSSPSTPPTASATPSPTARASSSSPPATMTCPINSAFPANSP